MNTSFDGRMTEPVEVVTPITQVLVNIEKRAARIMELIGDDENEIYLEANEIESEAGYVNLILAGEEL